MGRTLVALVLGCAVAACGLSTLPAVAPHAGNVRERDRLWAGMTEVDITPPVGLGMFGHGPESRVATGIALRLRCQIFVLGGPSARTGETETLALVPCELPAVGLYLQRKIAERVAGRHVPIAATRIALMATHTHYGPGHYFASEGYTGPFSSRRIGFDPAFAAFIAERVGDGIAEAYWHARPARLSWAYSDLTGLSRNRSVIPFLHNTALPAALGAAVGGNAAHPEEAAVDRRLSLLRIDTFRHDDHEYAPAGALAFFGVHPTVVSNRNSLYTGDLFGYATRHAVRRIGRPSFVMGLANGIEGDVTSARAMDTHRESRRLGHKLGDEIAALWSSLGGASADRFDTHGPLDVVYRELHWSAGLLDGGERLCAHPTQGTPAAGGAPDHPTTMRIFSAASPGVRAPPVTGTPPCGWPRFPLIGLDPDAPPGASYPDVAPLLLARIGRGVLATAPAELTTVTGLRARDDVAKALGAPSERVTVAGLTNEYLGYIATRDEYQLQHYEGASTLYGPDSERFLRQQLACLARAFAGTPAQPPCGVGQPGIDEAIDVRYAATTAEVLHEVAPPRAPSALSKVSAGLDYDGVLSYRLSFSGPDPNDVRSLADLDVAVLRAQARIEDTRGESIHLHHDEQRRRWTAQWRVHPDGFLGSCGHEHRFMVSVGARRVQSERFVVHCQLPEGSGVWP